jgi:hypothetical protein
MFIRIIKDWIIARKNNSPRVTLLIVVFVLLIFLIPIVTTVLPFTYIAL